MSAKKRRPISDLNKDNWEDEVSGRDGTEVESNAFRRANTKVLEQRRIIRAYKSPQTQGAAKSNQFSGVNLLNGGAKAPLLSTASRVKIEKQKAPVAPAPTQSVNKQEFLQQIRLHIGESHKNLSSLFLHRNKLAGSVTTTGVSTTSPCAKTTTASPATAAAPAFSFQAASAPAAPAPTAFSFTSPTPAAQTPAPAIVPPDASGDANGPSDTIDQQQDVSFADVPEKGWKRLLTVEQVKVYQLKNKSYATLGVGTLKLQQDETDSKKYTLRCGTAVSKAFFNSFLTGKANPKWGEEAKPGAKFRTIVLTLNDQEGSAQVYRLKTMSVSASEVLTTLQEAAKTMQK